MATKESKQSRQQRVAAMRKKQRSQERRERIVIFGATGLVAAALAAGGAWAVISQNDDDAKSSGALPLAISGQGTSAPPWQLPADPVAKAEKAGLTVQPMEGTAKHFHSHLDIIVNGKKVEVPANLGIHPAGNGMAELHTHDQRGVLHVEAPTKNKRYSVGQVFAEWDVRLDASNLGGLKADAKNTLRAYVDGKQFSGNPADIELKERGQIALVYGPPDAKVDVPDKYKFNPGE